MHEERDDTLYTKFCTKISELEKYDKLMYSRCINGIGEQKYKKCINFLKEKKGHSPDDLRPKVASK